MKHVVSFSTGLSSALTVERVLARYDPEDIEIVFMDTRIEDDDNYRFLADMRQRWGLPVTVLAEGRTPYQVATDHNMIPNQKLAPCTFELKIEMFVKYLKLFNEPLTIHIGYDFAESHRCAPTRDNYESQGWLVDFPLLWKPIEFRPYPQVCREDWGIEPPRMYGLGYSHANCGGICVKQGQGDWLRTLINFPERYAFAEEWERQMRDHPKRKDYAILRDQANGRVAPLTLEELRERYEAGQTEQLSLLDYQAPCVRCGVGDFADV
jgi:hypothetical protein